MKDEVIGGMIRVAAELSESMGWDCHASSYWVRVGSMTKLVYMKS